MVPYRPCTSESIQRSASTRPSEADHLAVLLAARRIFGGPMKVLLPGAPLRRSSVGVAGRRDAS